MRERKDFPDVLTLEEASEYLQVSTRTLGDLAREGKLPGAKIGREWRFLRADLDRMISGEHRPKAEG